MAQKPIHFLVGLFSGSMIKCITITINAGLSHPVGFNSMLAKPCFPTHVTFGLDNVMLAKTAMDTIVPKSMFASTALHIGTILNQLSMLASTAQPAKAFVSAVLAIDWNPHNRLNHTWHIHTNSNHTWHVHTNSNHTWHVHTNSNHTWHVHTNSNHTGHVHTNFCSLGRWASFQYCPMRNDRLDTLMYQVFAFLTNPFDISMSTVTANMAVGFELSVPTA